MKTTNVFNKNVEQLNFNNIIVNEGGTRSSKTFSILQLLINILFDPRIKNKTISVVSESLPHLKRGAMKDFYDILNQDNLYDIKKHNHTDHKYTMGTNTIEFFGVEDSSKVTGAGRDILFINECNNVPWEVFQQLQMRTRQLTFLDFNPVEEFWVHRNLLDTPKVGYIHSTYLDNPYVSQNTIDLLMRTKDTDPNFYKVYALGLIGSLEGVIFNFNIEDYNVENEKVIYAIDFGFTNDPTTLISIVERNKTLYIDEIIYEIGLTNEDISRNLEQFGIRKRYDIIYCDSAEPKSIEELYRRGWNVKGAVKGPDSILKGIDIMKQYKLVVSRRSTNLIKELRNYQWQKDKEGKFINRPVGADHCIDAIRYGVSMAYGITNTRQFQIAGKLKLR